MFFEGTKLKFLGKSFDIIQDDDVMKDETNMGSSSIIYGKITLTKKMPEDVKDETLLHEILHMIVDSNSIKLEEKDVCVISNCLYAILKDNNMLRSKE